MLAKIHLKSHLNYLSILNILSFFHSFFLLSLRRPLHLNLSFSSPLPMTSSQDSAPLTPITSNTSVNTSLKVMDELVDEQIFTLVTKPDDQNHASYQVSQMIQKAKRSKEIIKVANDCVKVMFIASRVNRTRATHHRTPTRRSRSWTQKLTSSLKPAELQKVCEQLRESYHQPTQRS